MDKRTPTPPNAVNSQPTTPRRATDNSADGGLQSTPSNRGSASTAEHLMGVRYLVINFIWIHIRNQLIIYRVDDISHSILADIRDYATCNVDALLNGLLSRCLPEKLKANPPADLLHQCINAVLPLCNSQGCPTTTKGKEKQANEKVRDGVKLRAYLQE
jgi:hypothetical protein